MTFTTILFLPFFLIVLILVRILPVQMRKYAILLANLVFYAGNGPKALLILVSVAAVTYFAGLGIGAAGPTVKGRNYKDGICLLISIGTVIGLMLFHMTGTIYPLGMSFYTLSAAGYLIDLYRGRIEPQRRPVDLFVGLSFFSIVQSGPIEKLPNLMKELDAPKTPEEKEVCRAFLQMLWGFLEKLAVSDIASLLVSEVFDRYEAHSGVAIITAVVVFAFQLYADFDGYSNLAEGSAGLLGIKVTRNFKQPYLSCSIKEFWRRWHISLSTWLKDYVYIPLGGSRKGNKDLNVFLTFLVSGLWHGIGLNFAVWGALHGLYQVLEEHWKGFGRHSDKSEDKSEERDKNEPKRGISKALIVIRTFLLADFAWLFFRARDLTSAVSMIRRIFTDLMPQSMSFREELAGSGITTMQLCYLTLVFVMLIVTDLMREKRKGLFERFATLPMICRTAICYAGILLLVLVALTNLNVNAAGFIYGQF